MVVICCEQINLLVFSSGELIAFPNQINVSFSSFLLLISYFYFILNRYINLMCIISHSRGSRFKIRCKRCRSYNIIKSQLIFFSWIFTLIWVGGSLICLIVEVRLKSCKNIVTFWYENFRIKEKFGIFF